MILNARNEAYDLTFHPTAGRGIGKSHRLKLSVRERRQKLPSARQKKRQDLRQEIQYGGDKHQ